MNYPQVHPIIRNYRRETAKIRELLNSDTENVILDGIEKLKLRLKYIYPSFVKLLKATKDLYWVAHGLYKEIRALEKNRDMLYDEIKRYQKAKGDQQIAAYFSPREENRVRTELRRKQEHLVRKKRMLDKQEQEYLIKQDELAIAIQDTNLAKNSYYRLSETEIELFEKERPKILSGIEKYGTIALACKKDPSIKMRPSSIMHYAQKHSQFAQDLEIAKQVFRDNVDAELIDRALNGTKNPVFQRGEYIGDYAVKDNKLLIELAKAKLPKEYNPRAYAAAHPQTTAGGTTINILSFDGVDETKRGFAKNIGVVKSVDDSGRVERITQNTAQNKLKQMQDAKKMLDFYKEKGTAEISENGLPDIPADAVLDAVIVENDDGGTV